MISLAKLLTTLVATCFLLACGGGSPNATESGPAVTIQSLGKKLFFDPALSSEGNQSCSSCHDPASGFADPSVTQSSPVSEGSVTAAFGSRNAPTTAYASFIPAFALTTSATVETASKYQGGQFLDGRRINLTEQAKDPFLNPVEMNNADAQVVIDKVKSGAYSDDFIAIFGETAFDDVDIAYQNIVTAIAAFESSAEMNSFSSKFDAVMAGQATFNPSEQRGFDLFQSDKAKCANCHTLKDADEPSIFSDFRYFNVGTPPNTDNPAYVADNNFVDEGLALNPMLESADRATERGKFRTPTLRNIELTAPYMHNGVYSTLQEVIEHYDITVTNADGFTGPYPEVDQNIATELNFGSFTPLGLTPQDYTDLENFMLTLTDGYL